MKSNEILREKVKKNTDIWQRCGAKNSVQPGSSRRASRTPGLTPACDSRSAASHASRTFFAPPLFTESPPGRDPAYLHLPAGELRMRECRREGEVQERRRGKEKRQERTAASFYCLTSLFATPRLVFGDLRYFQLILRVLCVRRLSIREGVCPGEVQEWRRRKGRREESEPALPYCLSSLCSQFRVLFSGFCAV